MTRLLTCAVPPNDWPCSAVASPHNGGMSSPSLAPIRVVTWNMAYWSHRRTRDEAWRWVLGELRPDVFLCQEAVVPEWVRAEHNVTWERSYPTGSQLWGTGIVTRLPCAPARVPGLDDWFTSIPASLPDKNEKACIHRADGWLATARVTFPSIGDLLVASVHSPAAPIEKARLAAVDVSGMKLKKNPDLWFLDVLFFFLRPTLGSRFLVGGDFNASRLLDVTLGDRGNNELFDRIADEGFVSLHRLFHDADEQTFFQLRRAPHQLDYLYADTPVAKYASACTVHPAMDFSDHAPMLAELKLG